MNLQSSNTIIISCFSVQTLDFLSQQLIIIYRTITTACFTLIINRADEYPTPHETFLLVIHVISALLQGTLFLLLRSMAIEQMIRFVVYNEMNITKRIYNALYTIIQRGQDIAKVGQGINNILTIKLQICCSFCIVRLTIMCPSGGGSESALGDGY